MSERACAGPRALGLLPVQAADGCRIGSPFFIAALRIIGALRITINLNFLDFEQPIAELEAKIDSLKHVDSDAELNLSNESGQARIVCSTRSLMLVA